MFASLKWQALTTRAPSIAAACILVLAHAGQNAQAQSQSNVCGELGNHYGPYDYRVDRDKLSVVERHHFTSSVEIATRGSTAMSAGPDLDYTLRAFPNHHRALMAAVRYGERMKSPSPSGMGYSVECYFDRALRFKPDDVVARMIYAQYLIKLGRNSDAGQQLEYTKTFASDNPLSHFNIGLLYFDMKDYPNALAQAHKVVALGSDRPELREMLQKAGHWKEPKEPGANSASSQTPSAAVSAEVKQ